MDLIEEEEKPQGPQYKDVWRLYILAGFTAMGWAIMGYNFAIYNSTVNYLVIAMAWSPEEVPFRQGLGFSIIPAGALVMLAITLWKFSRSSRRALLLVADGFTILGSILTTLPIFWVFILGRFLLGCGLGINGPIVPVFLRETAPPAISGKIGSASGIASQGGKLLGFILAFGLPLPPVDNGFWKVIYAAPIVLSLLRVLCLTIYYKYDTPKYYVLHRKDEDAKIVLAKIYLEEEAEQTFQKIQAEGKNERKMHFGALFEKYRTQLIIATMLAALMHLTGQQTLTAYSTAILTGTPVNDSSDTTHLRRIIHLNLITGIIRVFGSIFAGNFLDKLGRKVLLLIGTACTATGLIVLAAALQNDLRLLGELMVLLLSAGGSIGFGLVNPVYNSEVLPAEGNNLMLVVENVMNLSVNFAFPILVSWPSFGVSGALYTMGAIAVLGIIGIQYKVIETKGLSMYEIYNVFLEYNQRKNGGIESDDEERSSMLSQKA